jgi:UDP-glucuronate 4-epimerase
MRRIKILALGCNGFLGHNFTRKILGNDSFIFKGTLNNNSHRIEADQITRRHKDFIKFNPVSNSSILIKVLNDFQPNVVINFIANSNLFDNSKSKQESQNLDSLKNILRSVESSKTKIEHFFSLGTSQEYKSSLRPLKETDTLVPLSEYAKSKVKCHRYGLKWSAQNNVRFTTLRVFNVIGNDQFKENLFLKLIRLKPDEKFIFQQFNAIRDFIFIDDFISTLIKLLLNYKKISYDTLNIGTGVPILIPHLIELMSQALKRELMDSIAINNMVKLNSSYASINRLKNIIHLKGFKSVDEILNLLIKENDNVIGRAGFSSPL